MRTRIVVLLHGGQASSVYFPSKEEASKYIKDWMDAAIEYNGKTPPEVMMSRVISMSDDSGALTSAFSHPFIIGMYMPDGNAESCQEKTTRALEKLAEAASKEAGSGDEWKGK